MNPYHLTRSNQRMPGPQGRFESLDEALQAVEAWMALQGYVADMMAIMAGLEIHGPGGIEWKMRK